MVDQNHKAYVRLEKFNDSSIDILIICFTSTKDWEKYLEIKEDLAIKIKDSVEKGFSSQSIYVEKNTIKKILIIIKKYQIFMYTA